MPEASSQTAAIAIGSNLGDRRANIGAAFEALGTLPDTRLFARGPIIETPALTAPGLDPGGPYLNSAALLSTRLTPRDLLDHLHAIERSLGRTREGEPRWAPRTLDLDLVAYADRTTDEPGLTLPHPRAHERTFVLEPLAAIAPDLVIPGRGRVADLLGRVAGPGSQARTSPFAPALLLALLLAVVSGLGSRATAQAPLAPPPALPPTPREVLLELQQAYRTSPTCERIQVELRVPAPSPATGTRTTRSTISVQLQPPAPSAEADSPPIAATLALELGPLRIFAAAGDLTVIHARDPTSFYRSTIDSTLSPAVLNAALPQVLIPELDLMAAPADAPVHEFLPYATSIVWESVEVDSRHPSKRTVRGVCMGGGVGGSITLVEQNRRLRSLVIDLPIKRTTLTLTFASFGPCEPAKSEIDTARRTRVDAMDDLRPRSGTLRVGVRIPTMPITQGMNGADKGNWDMGALLQPPLMAAAAGVRPAEHVVLVFLRTPPLAPAGGDRRFDPDSLAAILKRTRDDAFRVRMAGTPEPERDPAAAIAKFGFAPVLVMHAPEPDEILERLKDTGRKWPAALWTTDARATIDLFSPGADAVAVILDAEYVLRAVIPIDQAQTAEHVLDQISASLFELGAGEAK
ncbi:MAG TPA: 2-amino-4-hydroxy-6-hydroxymethyldihydropteridine diphosphokinase [Phycisphaerales bacterium]|nr:2-amino-4-hydroxy-6-hydroxymethyldihydropteridine diphosphokinase [Phycisphaerales bacterium]